MSSQVEQTPSAGSSEVRTRDRRFWAAIIDVWLLAWVLGIAARALVSVSLDQAALGAVVAFPLLAAGEARTGRTPGKALTGLRTQRVGDGPVGWRRAAERRWWMALPALGLVPGIPAETGGLLLLVVLVTLVLSMGRSSDGRGWHDRLAGTEVVAVGSPPPSRGVVVLGVVAALLIVGAGWWLHTPAGGSTSFRSVPAADLIGCEVTHDGWLYPHHERTVTLEPGGTPFAGRFGPHDVTLAFVDDTDATATRRGLEIQVATRSLGLTTGQSTGSDAQIVDTTTGPGLGELVIRCRPTNGT